MFRKYCIVITAFVIAIPSFSEAQITIRPWYSCGSETDVFMVPGDMVIPFLDSGFTCGLLDFDERTSLGRACYLQWQFPRNNWLKYDVTGITDYVGLDCASLEPGGSAPGGGGSGGGGFAPGGPLPGGGIAPGGSASGGGSGTGSASVAAITPIDGTWRWDASCPTGQFAGFLSFERTASGISRSGTFMSGQGFMNDLIHSGDIVEFLRDGFNGQSTQYWSGSIVSSTRITGTLTESPPNAMTCTFDLTKRVGP